MPTIRTWQLESAVALAVLSLVAVLGGNHATEWLGVGADEGPTSKVSMPRRAGDRRQIMNIIVNGKPHEIAVSILSYGSVCDLADQRVANNPSCTYRVKLEGDAKREGILCARGSVKLAEGMVFNCMRTGNS